MGTRGTLAIAEKHELLLCNYNHFDSYPDGLGHDVIDFIAKRLKTREDRLALNAKTRNLTKVDESDQPDEATVGQYAEAWDENVYSGCDWYAILRRLQGAPFLDAIMDDKVFHQPFNKDFPKDSLFCEYAYCIDLGRNVLEVYKGSQKVSPPAGSRWELDKADDGYWPVKLVGEIPLDDIVSDPEKAKETMLNLFPKED